jgi:TrpR family trp operon transcriptional repressor
MAADREPKTTVDQEQSFKDALVKHLLKANNQNALHLALTDLLSPAEFLEISKRLQIFNRLKAGVPQRQIAEELGVGIATVTRGSRALKEQTNS